MSPTPVLQAGWVGPGVHVTTMGPKTVSEHEVDAALAERSDVIACDSPPQLSGYAEPSFLRASSAWDRILDLGDIVAGRAKGRTAPGQRTLFLSEGLAGTEVLLAAELLRRA